MVLEDSFVELVKKIRCKACKNVAVGEVLPEWFVNST
jgi:hypothetical protein